MRKQLIYIVLSILAFVACEEIYNPVLDKVDNLLVVEAILISNQTTNFIHLNKTESYNVELNNFSPVTGARVYLVDKNNLKTQCNEITPGNYLVNIQLQNSGKYSLLIEAEGETFVSEWQEVPEVPVMDSIYPEFDSRTITTGVANSTEDIKTEKGIQIYADMENMGTLNHYRFSLRKVLQYYNFYDTLYPMAFEPVSMPIFCWNTFYPTGVFNIAGPPEYSTVNNINKHKLEFFEQNYNKYIVDTLSFAGWIYSVYQYGINEDTYNYYSDLNSQLDAEGRIFDPVFIQAEGNISCTSNPSLTVLGNFEISSFSEKRYFLAYLKGRDTITSFKNIPYFYDIPERGEIKDVGPDFWETATRKVYPNE